MFAEEIEIFRERSLLPAAIVQAALYNVNNDYDKRPQGWTAMDFMPGAKTEEDEMREFVEAVQRGDSFEPDPEEVERFKWAMQSRFSNVKTVTS